MLITPFLIYSAITAQASERTTDYRVLISFVRNSSQPSVASFSDPNSTITIGFQVDGLNSINLLKENCSWGYEMIRFQMMNPAGGMSNIVRKRIAWYRNVPIPMLVQQGETVTRTAKWSDGTWVGIPAENAGRANGWKIRAALKLKNEFPLAERNIWSGTATSEWLPARW